MNHKTLLAAPMLIVALVGCNDKSPDYQQPSTSATAPETAAAPAAQVTEYKGDLTALGKAEMCALDAVNGKTATEGSFRLPANSSLALEGWAATTSLTNPRSVTVVLSAPDRAFAVSGNAGVPRDDVAKAYKTEALTNAGFKLEVPTLQIPTGEYTIAILHDESGSQVLCASPLKLVIE